MGFTDRGGFVVIFALITAGICVAALLPNIFWSKAEVDVSNSTIHVDKFVSKLSLWRQCNKTTSGNTTTKDCSHIRKIDWQDIKTEDSAERNGAIAGLVIGGLFALASLLGVCCQSKCATVPLALFALIFTAATVGCYVRYNNHTLDGYDLYLGFWLACVACAAAFFSSIGSCCMNRKDAEYEILA